VVKADNTAVLTHVVEVEDDAAGTWFEAFVDAATGELVSVTDFVAKATYRVVPIWKTDPTAGFETLVNPEDKDASPYGWLSTDGVTSINYTGGNNVAAAVNGATAPPTAPSEFVYPYNPFDNNPSTTSQKNAAIVNAFYVVNSLHDITYKYGFTEATFNFQQNNTFGAGAVQGKGNDRVLVFLQDKNTLNNAGFGGGADGTPGKMYLGMWRITGNRDSAMGNDIVAHEMTHGVTTRYAVGCGVNFRMYANMMTVA
jgi:extracellular elastinolytic metalloproteinase